MAVMSPAACCMARLGAGAFLVQCGYPPACKKSLQQGLLRTRTCLSRTAHLRWRGREAAGGVFPWNRTWEAANAAFLAGKNQRVGCFCHLSRVK